MASKRPSYPMIRARQRNLIEGLERHDLTYSQAAKEFGVTRQQLKTFVETKPKNLRRQYNRSPAYQKLYREGEHKYRKRTREYANIPQKGVEYTPREIKHQQINKMIQNLYIKNHAKGATWANYAREHGLPSSLDAIILLHNNGKIDDDRFVSAINAWQNIYGVSESRVTQVLGDLEEAA